MKNLIQFLLLLISVLKRTWAEEVIYAQVGQTVTLSIPRLHQDSYIKWYFGKVEGEPLAWMNNMGGKNTEAAEKMEIWKNKLILNTGSLTIKNIQAGNFGKFSAEVSVRPRDNPSWKDFRLVNVRVDVKPASLVIPGVSVELSCNVETHQGQRRPTIYWLSPEQKSMSENQAKYSMTAKSQDNGDWTCVVNDQLDFKFPIPVSVANFEPSAPQYTSINSHLNVPFSIKPEKFLRQIIHNIKEVKVSFLPKTSSIEKELFSFSMEDMKPDTVDKNSGLSYTNFTEKGVIYLKRRTVREEDRGNYSCSIKFKNNFELISYVQVEVLKITPSPGTELISGQQLNLSCTLGDHLPPGLKVKWTPPKQKSQPKLDYLQEHLVFPKVSTKLSGMWECELWKNFTSLTSTSITLKIDPILSVWMMVIICSAAVILILLLVVGYILYRRRQRKMRHIRHRLCKCENPKPKGFYKT